jgi:ABC-2 type transport system permease protein
MDKILAIIRREYVTRVRSKGFIIATVLSPLIMTSFILVPVLIARSSSSTSYHLTVLDQAKDDSLYNHAVKQLTGEAAKADRIEVSRELGTGDPAQQEALNQQLGNGGLSGYVVIPPDVLEHGKVTLHARNVTDFARIGRINNAFESAILWRRMEKAGIDSSRVEALRKDIDVQMVNERGESEQGQSFVLGYALVLILYVTILIYGLMVMRGVIEEKQSRIVEVLLSSVKPFQLMLGKLFGIGLVGLTQYVIWTTFTILVSGFAMAQAMMFSQAKLPRIPVSLLIFFVIYFLLGYFLYATLYALIGATVSSDEDGQHAQTPITMMLVIQMVLLSLILRSPDGTAATVLSLIPFFGPIIMFMRICVQTPPWWQIAFSIVSLIATILGTAWVAGKIYRVGVLMYGKRPNLPELARWLKYS